MNKQRKLKRVLLEYGFNMYSDIWEELKIDFPMYYKILLDMMRNDRFDVCIAVQNTIIEELKESTQYIRRYWKL